MIGSALLVVAGALAVGQDLRSQPRLDASSEATDEEFAFVELTALPAACYVQQPIRLWVRLGVEEEFLLTRSVQPFRQRLDVPVHLVAPWIEALPGARALGVVDVPLDVDGREPVTFALNEGIRLARRIPDRLVEDRRFRVYEIEAGFLPTSVGELRFSAPVLALAHAARFEESLLDERVPVDRTDVRVSGEPLVVQVEALPEEGRPWAFTGAVGSFTARAEVVARELRFGESLTLELSIEGEGNLAWFPTPDWREIGPFRVLGILDQKTPAARTLTFHLKPASDRVRQVPAISFVYFDPGPPAAYRTAETEPIDIVVNAAAAGAGVAPPPRDVQESRLPREIQQTPEEPGGPSRSILLLCSAAGVLVLALIAVLVARRRG